ncbi:hypothetical protein [Actinacidiphila acididurans]|uniref:Uncharacterized protein n=1 Tax=Actinacidiphila acididurans TaxID=2784346 RepID=A0ABS2TXE5_9ACTN|nr:hypothetical protein [Actinacidiphila acididurans]MBM9508020.1 hypothetical protein [Actinacidiphila acididurans]
MNPHDPAVRPGARLVADGLGVDDPRDLSDRHPSDDPLRAVGWMVAAAALEVDALHADLIRAAQSAIDVLEPISRGEAPRTLGSYGLFEATGPRIELLAARRSAAYEHLTRAVSAYQRLLLETADPSAAHENKQHLDAADPGRDDDWAVAGERQTVALRAVARGGLRLGCTAIGNDPYVAGDTGDRPAVWPETVQRMLAGGLLHLDTSTSLYEGQRLSLTDRGEAALRATDSQTSASRVHAGANDAPDRPPAQEELVALEEIEHGRVLVMERGFRNGLYVATDSSARISLTTVDLMQTEGWVVRDTTSALSVGQVLSLTPRGEAALRTGRAQDPRATAALRRTAHSSGPTPEQGSPAGLNTAARPARSR